MSKMGNELERLLDENKYSVLSALVVTKRRLETALLLLGISDIRIKELTSEAHKVINRIENGGE